jgi:hypothetical protein
MDLSLSGRPHVRVHKLRRLIARNPRDVAGGPAGAAPCVSQPGRLASAFSVDRDKPIPAAPLAHKQISVLPVIYAHFASFTGSASRKGD